MCKVLSAQEFADLQNPDVVGNEGEDHEDDSGDTLEPLPSITQAEGLSSLTVVRRFLLQLDEVPEDILDICHRIENLLLVSSRKKQTKIDDLFFKKL